MVKPEAPDGFSWTISIILHVEIILFGALMLYEEDVVPFDLDPSVYSGVVYSSWPHRPPLIPYERMSDWTGRWPIHCDHGDLVRMFRKWPDEVVADTRCRECGWPWWVIRAGVARD